MFPNLLWVFVFKFLLISFLDCYWFKRQIGQNVPMINEQFVFLIIYDGRYLCKRYMINAQTEFLYEYKVIKTCAVMTQIPQKCI